MRVPMRSLGVRIPVPLLGGVPRHLRSERGVALARVAVDILRLGIVWNLEEKLRHSRVPGSSMQWSMVQLMAFAANL